MPGLQQRLSRGPTHVAISFSVSGTPCWGGGEWVKGNLQTGFFYNCHLTTPLFHKRTSTSPENPSCVLINKIASQKNVDSSWELKHSKVLDTTPWSQPAGRERERERT